MRSATGSVSSNTVTGGFYGIITSSDGVSITANKVFNSTGAGIYLTTPTVSIQNNDIAHANVGIGFNCVANPNVIQNTINEAQTGLDQVPIGLAVTNTFFNALSQRVGCCRDKFCQTLRRKRGPFLPEWASSILTGHDLVSHPTHPHSTIGLGGTVGSSAGVEGRDTE